MYRSMLLAVAVIRVFPAAAQISEEQKSLNACAVAVLQGIPPVAKSRDVRFEGKVSQAAALCRGGQQALLFHNTPWVDWSHYFGTGDSKNGPVLRGGPGRCWILRCSALN